MENQNTETKKTYGMISFRVSPEIKETMERIALEKGITVAEYLRTLAEDNINSPEGKKKPPVKNTSESLEKSEDLVALVNEVLKKADVNNDLLSKLIENSETETITEEEFQNGISEAVNAAVQEQEEDFRSQHLILRFNERQRDLLINLLSFRKLKGEDGSESIEHLIISAIKHKVLDSVFFPTIPEGFKAEFKETFAEYLAPKTED